MKNHCSTNLLPPQSLAFGYMPLKGPRKENIFTLNGFHVFISTSFFALFDIFLLSTSLLTECRVLGADKSSPIYDCCPPDDINFNGFTTKRVRIDVYKLEKKNLSTGPILVYVWLCSYHLIAVKVKVCRKCCCLQMSKALKPILFCCRD